MNNITRDGLQNLISGMGTGIDKASYTQFVAPVVSTHELIQAYRGNWIAKKIVDIVAEDMAREWREWSAEATDITTLEEEERRLKLKRRVTDALRWARLMGGSALILGITDGMDPDQPVALDRVQRGGLRWVHAVPKTKLSPGQVEDDIEDPNFGHPRSFMVGGSMTEIKFHHSRVVTFMGTEPPPDQVGDGWGDSILLPLYDVMRNASTISSSIASLLHEAKIDIIAVPGLSQHLATTEGEARLKSRFSLASLMKSLHNILLLGDGEKHDTKQVTWNGLPEIHVRFLQEVSGAADIPVTRLLGQAPSGLQATGEHDLRMYYDMIKAKQNDELTPAFEKIDPILQRSAFGGEPDDGVFYSFASLWQTPPEVLAEINHKNAQSFALDVNSGVFQDEEMRRARSNQIVESGSYPGFEQILEEVESEFGEVTPPNDEPPPPPGQPEPTETGDRSRVKDAEPRTLYVRRDVKNGDEILAWARSQGIAETLDASDLHVTIAFSRQPVDWMKAGGYPESPEIVIPEGGPRLVEFLGEARDALVLMFSSWELSWRHGQIREAGASWDWPDYQPHVTISWRAGDVDERSIEPYRGRIVLGPEVFEEVDEDWKASRT